MNYKITCIAALTLIPIVTLANPPADHYGPLSGHRPHHGHSFLHHSPHHGGMKFGDHLPPYLRDIALTDSQKKNIQGLIQQQQAAMQDLSKARIDKRFEIQQRVLSKDYSEGKIADLIEKSMSEHKEKILSMAKLDHTIFELLTPAQQQQVQANLKKFSAHIKEMQ